MRLREPFNGMKLSSGYWLIHLVYFGISFVPMNIAAEGDLEDEIEAARILFCLRCAHLLVPLFRLCGFLSSMNR